MRSQNDENTNKDTISHPNPKLSIVIATKGTWSTIAEYLKPILDQAQALSAEVIVADGNGQALPDSPHASVIWLREIGSSVYRLRAIGAKKAQGHIVAFTEDHCKVATDWCEQIINAHQKHPDVAVISGVIENGSTESILDRIHFLMAKGPFMRPITAKESHLISGEPNISFKKYLLPSNISKIDFSFYQDIQKQALKTRIHEDIIVWHTQSLGLRGTCRMHFHTGKTIGGFRLPHLTKATRLLRIGSCAILPGFLTVRTFLTVIRKRREHLTPLLGLPLLLLLATCHSVGELCGYLVGPGKSPYRMN